MMDRRGPSTPGIRADFFAETMLRASNGAGPRPVETRSLRACPILCLSPTHPTSGGPLEPRTGDGVRGAQALDGRAPGGYGVDRINPQQARPRNALLWGKERRRGGRPRRLGQHPRKVSQAIGSSISPTIFPRVEACDDDGRGYIKVSFEGDEAPYSCNGRFRMRVADEDLMMSDEELRSQVLRAQARRVPWDQRESPRPISDVDEEELRSFVERGNACGRIAESFTTVEDTLGRLKLLRNGRLTNAAEVLFCPSRTAALKMGILATHSRTEILDIVQEEGTLFHLVRAAERYILVNTRRKVIVDGVGPREEVPELPPAAVREVLFNAFAHRDWTSRACVQVDIFADSVEITNPGWFIEGQDPADHISGVDHSSLSRNDLIVTTLHKSRDIEAYGTGDSPNPRHVRRGGGGVRVRARAHRDEVRLPSGRPVLRRPLAANGRQRPPTAANGRQACRKTTVGSSSSSGRTERPRPPWSRRNSASPCARRGRRSAASLTRA